MKEHETGVFDYFNWKKEVYINKEGFRASSFFFFYIIIILIKLKESLCLCKGEHYLTIHLDTKDQVGKERASTVLNLKFDTY